MSDGPLVPCPGCGAPTSEGKYAPQEFVQQAGRLMSRANSRARGWQKDVDVLSAELMTTRAKLAAAEQALAHMPKHPAVGVPDPPVKGEPASAGWTVQG